MAIADLRAGKLDIRCTRGNDIPLRCTFNIDLTGWTGWEANALPADPRSDTPLPFDVDTSEQATGVIAVSLLAADTATFAAAFWDLKAVDPDGHPFTLLEGTIRAQSEVS